MIIHSMIRKLLLSFGVAIQNIKSNPLHTLLSTLGIVIGVAALVSILSLADGMEDFARSQIATTTSLHSVSVTTKTRERVDNVWVPVDDYPILNQDYIKSIKQVLPKGSTVKLTLSGSAIVTGLSGEERIGVTFYAVVDSSDRKRLADNLWRGEMPLETVPGDEIPVVVGKDIAERLAKKDSPEEIIGTSLKVDHRTVRVTGILSGERVPMFSVAIPFDHFSERELRTHPPQLQVEGANVEMVPVIEQKLEAWLDANIAEGAEAFRIFSNRMRIDQTRQAIMLFKLVMGLITGISVIVGGIGVMNVLLISVTERTQEIGIRKATGAKRRDIILQFLSESVTVSALGSFMGLLLGILISLAAKPLVQYLLEIPFHVAFRGSTLIIIGLIALFVGIVFGTYPAMRAARLTPVEAIRRE